MSKTKNAVLEELKPHRLTSVIGRKPTFHDIETWEEECSTIATLIKTNSIQGGNKLGHLATIIPEDEYRLEIEDNDFEYEEPTDPGPYNPDITGNEDDHVRARMEAEHKQRQQDYEKYLGVQEHLLEQFKQCINETWIIALRRPRSGYTTRTIREILAHLRTDVTSLTAEERTKLKKGIELEWDQTKHITQYFVAVEDEQIKIEGWIPGCNLDEEVMDAALMQMKACGLFDHRFMRDWDRKTAVEKTWMNLKSYFTEEYAALKKYEEPSPKALESINSLSLKDDTESEITEFFDKLRRDATVSKEQIQQMANSFKGASETMGEVMARLKSAMEEIKTLNKTVSTLMENNKMLVETIKAMGGSPPEAKETPKTPHPNKCPHCGNLHKKPFDEHCRKLKKNNSS